MVTPFSRSQRVLVSPFRNQISSLTIERRCSFFVVTSGKPSARSKRICQPKTERVPTPVRSAFSTPRSRTWRIRSRYCLIARSVLGRDVAASAQRRDLLLARYGGGTALRRLATGEGLATREGLAAWNLLGGTRLVAHRRGGRAEPGR